MGSALAQQRRYHSLLDAHVRSRWLSDLVLGTQDGVVNTLGVVLGVASATPDARVVLATGFAAAAAESISMAAVAYTSSLARGDLYRAERAREYRHIETVPLVERGEIEDIFRRRGFTGKLLDRAVETVCQDRDVWVAMMMSEEHALNDVSRRASLRSAAIVGLSSVVASVPPVLPFALFRGLAAVVTALALGVGLLGVVGVIKARMTTGSSARSGAALATIGLASALAGYAVGSVFAPR